MITIRRTEATNHLAVGPRTAPRVEAFSATDPAGHWLGTYATLDSAKNFAANGREHEYVWTEVEDGVWTGTRT